MSRTKTSPKSPRKASSALKSKAKPSTPLEKARMQSTGPSARKSLQTWDTGSPSSSSPRASMRIKLANASPTPARASGSPPRLVRRVTLSAEKAGVAGAASTPAVDTTSIVASSETDSDSLENSTQLDTQGMTYHGTSQMPSSVIGAATTQAASYAQQLGLETEDIVEDSQTQDDNGVVESPRRQALATLLLEPAAVDRGSATNPFGLNTPNQLLESIERRVAALGIVRRAELAGHERLEVEIKRFREVWDKQKKRAFDIHDGLETAYYHLEHVHFNLDKLAGEHIFN
ncbi:hypothetical protein BJ912DRAFT_923176 [Pholiota molesta]|nr:hypothetical protein BJ912DRAFT_923176 [Pholiota molesta]